MGAAELIKTSDENWLAKTGEKYKRRVSFELVDDAELGIDPARQTLAGMGVTASIGMSQWIQLGGVFGIGATGVGLITLAILDPEPTSKLGLIVGTGGFLAITGGLGGMYVLTGFRPSSVEMDKEGRFRVRFA